MTIRTATINDLHILTQISEQTFRDAFENNNTSAENFEGYVKKAFSLAQLKSEIESPDNIFLLVENDDKKAIGYGKLRKDNRRKELLNGVDSIEIERIYATKEYWGKGVGTILMLRMLELTHELNYKYICLAVYEENPKAIRFYERFGFKSVGMVEFKLGDIVEHDVLMLKEM